MLPPAMAEDGEKLPERTGICEGRVSKEGKKVGRSLTADGGSCAFVWTVEIRCWDKLRGLDSPRIWSPRKAGMGPWCVHGPVIDMVFS
jgi:hypothetical protein